MRISDWSSDVCSSDLDLIGADDGSLHLLLALDVHHQDHVADAAGIEGAASGGDHQAGALGDHGDEAVLRYHFRAAQVAVADRFADPQRTPRALAAPSITQTGRASCRERGGQYGVISGVAGPL